MAGFGRPPNRLRGEVVAKIDGENRILCLTLGALAELEAIIGQPLFLRPRRVGVAVDQTRSLRKRIQRRRASRIPALRLDHRGLRVWEW